MKPSWLRWRMMGRKKAETPAPPRVVALQAQLVATALAEVPAIAGDMELALKTTIERLTPLVAQALATLAASDPDAFLKHYANLAEFKMPKLARVEHKVAGGVDHRHFVAVEHRDESPEDTRRRLEVVSEQ